MTVVTSQSSSRFIQWAGFALSALTTAFLLWDAALGLLLPDRLRASAEETGFQFGQVAIIGGIALVCGILYALPRTAFLGAILTTGFLGGAICAHFRLGEIGSPPQLVALLVGVMAWGGLYLRDAACAHSCQFAPTRSGNATRHRREPSRLNTEAWRLRSTDYCGARRRSRLRGGPSRLPPMRHPDQPAT